MVNQYLLCQFPCYKYSHHIWYQATVVMSLTWSWEEVQRTGSHQPPQASSIHSLRSIYSQTSGRTSKAVSFLRVLLSELCWTILEPSSSSSCSVMSGSLWPHGPPGSSFHGIVPTRILEWVASFFSRGSSWPWNQAWSPTLQADSLPSEPPVQFSSVAQLCLTLCNPITAAQQASLSITNSWSLPKLMSVESLMPSNHLILCHPLLLMPSIFPRIRVFSNESTLCIRWPTYWSFSFNVSPSNEHPGLISFRMDQLDFLAVQGTLKSLLSHHSSKASILRYSAFFIVQLSHPYMTNGKTIVLTRWSFVGKVMSLLLNMLSRLVITFLPRSKRLLISWLQSPSAVILEP